TEGCGHEHRIIAYCKIKYCDHLLCVKNRYIEALQKLVSFKIRSKQLFHYSIGSNRMSMSDVRIYTNRVILSMRRKGWTMTTIRVLDIDARNSEIKGVNFYHVHIAQFGEAIDVKKFNTDIRASIKRINDDLVFSIFGWRPQRNVFEYFAKRIACQFGHKDKEGIYFLPEVMDFKEFVETYHNKKILTLSDPEGLINIKGDVAKKLMCPICEIPLIYAGLTTEGHEKDEKRKPPW
ncbi:MAG: hypothetical protein GOV02_03870, partial [Candidatus Aenigmarchaeota archaeon]|nr:hypothetical protein [Candidatus Aenigmarchaeota archaeon]